MIDLTLLMAIALVICVLLYVVLDGFDLGIGMLFPLLRDATQREEAIASIAPLWDGNETWLVAGGMTLFAAFPAAFAVILPALYMPLGFMLTALVVRGVAFEFRERALDAGRRFWDQAFHWGSSVAALSQGLALGTLIQGIPVTNGEYAGGDFDWLTPFSLLTAFALAVGYVLLGACWLMMRTSSAARLYARRVAIAAGVVLGIMMCLVGLWMAAVEAPLANRGWFNAVMLAWLPLLAAILLGLLTLLVRAAVRDQPVAPFVYAASLFGVAFLGLVAAVWPFIVPYAMTFDDAAAADNSLGFLIVAYLVLLPMVGLFAWNQFHTFRGRVRRDDTEPYA